MTRDTFKAKGTPPSAAPSAPVRVETGLLRWVKAQADDPDANPRFRELYAALSQQPDVDGCHCGTCTCNPNMTPAVRFDLSPAQQEGAIREHLIRLGWTPPVGAAEDMVLDAIERRESSAPVGVKTLSEFMAEQEALHPGIHDKVQAAADELRADLAQQTAAAHEPCAAVAAIQFALTDPEGMTFLRLWNEGEFDTLRREWPDAPSEVYVGADPLA